MFAWAEGIFREWLQCSAARLSKRDCGGSESGSAAHFDSASGDNVMQFRHPVAMLMLVAGTFGLLFANATAMAEMLLCAAVLSPVLRNPEFQRCVAGMPKPFATGGFLLLALVVGGHLAGNPAKSFPFPQWGMYGELAPTGPMDWYSIDGVTAEGRTVEINASHLYPPLGRGTFRLVNRVQGLMIADDKGLVVAGVPPRKILSELLLAFAKQWNATHDPDVVEIRLRRHRRELGSREATSEVYLTEALR